ncbi:MAG: hypothetical protein ACKPKO_04170, partial [Candidatus Fonsibacter sp.]
TRYYSAPKGNSRGSSATARAVRHGPYLRNPPGLNVLQTLFKYILISPIRASTYYCYTEPLTTHIKKHT